MIARCISRASSDAQWPWAALWYVRHDGAKKEVEYVDHLPSTCCARDEGRPLGLGLQDQSPNRNKLL